ncbi:hypothetical protein [Paenirhodobacter populi]|uniref:hypothetical protein n=1 Tax=Paenirhodobacter populi TaxID=2306993 RepID=UPI000FE40DCD|nr:hypothetical protein [Sinirhodobacter populi]RWR09719.1 hypothetical protein D2T32_05075 [Sinirhodobacter populi]
MQDGDELRPLTEEEAAMVAAYPLPAGAADALVNKAQLEVGLNTTATTISAWLRKGLPFEEEGTNGRSYKFRLSVAYAWVERMRAEEQGARAAGDAAVAQLQLALLGGETATASGGKMSLADQRRLIELEMQRTAAARERRDLVRRADMVVAFEEVFAAIRDANDALPDRLARELGLDARAVEIVVRACDDTMRGARLAVRKVIGDDDGGDEREG